MRNNLQVSEQVAFDSSDRGDLELLGFPTAASPENEHAQVATLSIKAVHEAAHKRLDVVKLDSSKEVIRNPRGEIAAIGNSGTELYRSLEKTSAELEAAQELMREAKSNPSQSIPADLSERIEALTVTRETLRDQFAKLATVMAPHYADRSGQGYVEESRKRLALIQDAFGLVGGAAVRATSGEDEMAALNQEAAELHEALAPVHVLSRSRRKISTQAG